MDKNSYMAGEVAQIHVDVDNQSAVDIENFVVKVGRVVMEFICGDCLRFQLMRVIHLKGKDDDRSQHDSLRLVDVVCQNKYDGCKAHDQKSR